MYSLTWVLIAKIDRHHFQNLGVEFNQNCTPQRAFTCRLGFLSIELSCSSYWELQPGT